MWHMGSKFKTVVRGLEVAVARRYRAEGADRVQLQERRAQRHAVEFGHVMLPEESTGIVGGIFICARLQRHVARADAARARWRRCTSC
eukprot:scaffold717_cov60-Phaeocystis_antarctica.AAC.4